ncbi:MAG: class I SAM-dependent methyltransferase [Nanoarchaeota archaeon]
MDPETEFLCGLIELQYGLKVQEKLTVLAAKIPWAQNWPEDQQAFWNAEAFMWQHKISQEKRQLISQELKFLIMDLPTKNLDLGCGAYSYLPSVGMDFSDKMLQFNDQCTEKITADLESPLPVKDNSFNSVTAIFVLNYIKNYSGLLLEINRVLKEGVFVMVLYSKQINEWQRQKEVNAFTAEDWKAVLNRAGFIVDFYEKEGLWFFKCKKLKD